MIDITENNKTPVIWIPCSNNSSKIQIDKPKAFSNLIINYNDRKFRISTLSEETNYNLNYDTEYKNSVILPVKENDVVINSKFYMAIVHYSIVNKLNIPSIFTLISEKSNWHKS